MRVEAAMAGWLLVLATAFAADPEAAPVPVRVDVPGVPTVPLPSSPAPSRAAPVGHASGGAVVQETPGSAVLLTREPVSACTCSTLRLTCQPGAAGVRVTVRDPDTLDAPHVGWCQADGALLSVTAGDVLVPEPFEAAPGAWVVPYAVAFPDGGVDVLFLPRKAGWSVPDGAPCTLHRRGKGLPWVVTLTEATDAAAACLVGHGTTVSARAVRYRGAWETADGT